MKRLAVIAMSILLVVLSVFAIGGYSATEITHEEEYKPLDLVVVVDGSGSMLSSDKDRTAPAAVRMLVNMMPAESRVGIISFNTKPTVLTKNTSGKGDLISLETISGVETVRDASSSIRYSGDTGIGNALFGATELLRQNSDNEHDKAIILFTDGLNDFGSGPLAAKNLSACDENESKAIMWAKENDCCIYCIGYDYKTSSGVSSMGKNGEGITKLTNVAESTDGKFKAIKNIDDAKQLLIEFLADVCDLIYTTIDVIPGDGGYHECPIPVSPSVVEANIRIAGGDKNSIKNGTIKLQDPNGKEIELKNKGNIRVDKDATAQSIKIILPQPGEWILSVDGVVGDDIEVGLLEHFKMNLSSELTFPEGNPQGVAYSNDTIGIKTWLSYEGEDLVDQAIYDAVKSATATCVSRANPEDKKVVELSQNGTCFEGSFTIEEDSYYDIFIRVEWDTVYREDTLTVMSSNKPLGLVDQIEDVSVNKKKTVVIDNIYGYVSDDENDDITAQVEALNDDVVDVKIDGDQLVITGKKGWWANTLATVTYTDAQGNVVESTFKIFVQDILAWIILILTFLLLAAVIISIPLISYFKSLRIKGDLYLVSVELVDNSEGIEKYENFDFTNGEDLVMLPANPNAIVISMRNYYRYRQKRSVDGLIRETLRFFDEALPGSDEFAIGEVFRSKVVRSLTQGADKSKIIGTPLGESFKVTVSKKTLNLKANKSTKAVIEDNSTLELTFREQRKQGDFNDPNSFALKYYFVTPVRNSRTKKKRRY